MVPDLGKLSSFRSQVDKICEKYGVSRVRVFGSVAKGSAGVRSDLDLLIALAPHRTLLDVIGFEQDVAALLDCRVDVVVEGGIHPMLEAAVLREARAF